MTTRKQLTSKLFFTVLILLCSFGGVIVAHSAPVIPCKARQIEVFQEGGDAGLGSSGESVGLRNVSNNPCTLFGVPQLRFFDKAGHALAIPYTKNRGAMMEQSQPIKSVLLAPGDFATFAIGTTTGDEQYRFYDMRMVLPGDQTPLSLGNWADFRGGKQSIDVSAITAGVDKDLGWAAPLKSIAVKTGSLPGMLLELRVPEQPEGQFDVHLTLRNTDTRPHSIDRKICTLEEELTNSAGKVVPHSQGCGGWSGEITEAGILRPGARATADISVGDMESELCRLGIWSDKFTFQTTEQLVQFEPVAVSVVSTQCSDSEHVGDYVDESAIRWTLVAQHGVRLGVAVTAKDGTTPAAAPLVEGRSHGQPAPQFHTGEPIELRLYLDNLSDQPIGWRSGPDAFRVVLEIFGSRHTQPEEVSADGKDDASATLLPHRWQYAQSMSLTDIYHLEPGSYDVIIGARTLLGDAAAANSPATGWPYAEGSATVRTFVKIVP